MRATAGPPEGGGMTDTIVRTDRLSKRYGDRLAVDSVSLTVRRGEGYGFLGPNGAGKTTTLRMVLGLVRPSGGAGARLGGTPGPPPPPGPGGAPGGGPGLFPPPPRPPWPGWARWSRGRASTPTSAAGTTCGSWPGTAAWTTAPSMRCWTGWTWAPAAATGTAATPWA